MKLQTAAAFAAGPLMTAALSALTIPAIAWAFSPADIGRLNLMQTVVSFAVLGLGLGLDQAYVREFHATDARPALLTATATPGFLILAACGILLTSQATRLSVLLYGTPNPLLSWITLLCVAAAYSARFTSLVLRMQERAVTFSASQVVPKVVLIALVGVLAQVDTSRDFLELALAFTAATVTGLMALTWWARSEINAAARRRFESKTVRHLLRYSIPLMLAALAYSGFGATTSLVLRVHSTFAELGVYSITTSAAGVAGIAQAVFSIIWAPIAYRWIAEDVDMTRVGTITRQAIAVVALMFVLCGTFAWLLDFVLPREYVTVKYLLTAAIAQPLLYTASEITGIGVGITRRTTLSLWSTVLALGINLGLSIVLVPRSGAGGAIVANAVGYLAFFVARTEASAIVWRSFPRIKTYTTVAACVILSIANVALGPTLGPRFAIVWLAAAPLTIWGFHRELSDLLRTVRARKFA